MADTDDAVTDLVARAELLEPLGSVTVAGRQYVAVDLVAALLVLLTEQRRREVVAALRAAAQEQRDEADRVPWDNVGTHAAGHRCAAYSIDRRADLLAEGR